jgi:hypothetical protein
VVVVVVVVTIVPVVVIVMVNYHRRRFRLVLGITLVHAEHAFHAADHAANCAADDRAERTGNAVTFVKAVSGPTGNAARGFLRLSG